jgi:hypothetical protein
VMMVAEKAADLIRGGTVLPPEPLPFYRVGAPLEPPPGPVEPPLTPPRQASIASG